MLKHRRDKRTHARCGNNGTSWPILSTFSQRLLNHRKKNVGPTKSRIITYTVPKKIENGSQAGPKEVFRASWIPVANAVSHVDAQGDPNGRKTKNKNAKVRSVYMDYFFDSSGVFCLWCVSLLIHFLRGRFFSWTILLEHTSQPSASWST